jgi:hypothetical protein
MQLALPIHAPALHPGHRAWRYFGGNSANSRVAVDETTLIHATTRFMAAQGEYAWLEGCRAVPVGLWR